MRLRCVLVLFVLLSAPELYAQACASGVCVVGFEAPDQTTTFEVRNLRSESVVVSLWMEELSGMTASAPLPMTVALAPGDRREVLTIRRADAAVPGRYRYLFDWRYDPPTACLSPLACAWWERTPEASTFYALRKVPFPITMEMVGTRGDTTAVTLTTEVPTVVVRLGPNARRPVYRLSARPGDRSERYDSTRVYPLPYRGTFRVVQTPEEIMALRAAQVLPPPLSNSTPALVWETPPGLPVRVVREGVVVNVEDPDVALPADTVNSGNRMVITRQEDSGATVIVVHSDGTIAQYSGLDRPSIGVRPGTLVRPGDVIGAVEARGRLGLCLQSRLNGQIRFIPARFQTKEGPQRLVSGMMAASSE
ncbi:MAG TPA: hypothetical protein VD948_12825 [Rhodothermales bacterium]|nr:hypothetical protein [Rhodothermales bacterium]